MLIFRFFACYHKFQSLSLPFDHFKLFEEAIKYPPLYRPDKMAQTFQALKCFKCQTFQVQIKKKSNRWSCKLCGEKQSFMQIYGEGSSKDCRIHVQRLNSLRAAQEAAVRAEQEDANDSEDIEANSSLECTEGDASGNASSTSKSTSKWSSYLENDAENSESDSEEEESYEPVNTHSRNRTKLSSKWADYLDNDSSTSACGKTKRKAEHMTESNACAPMNPQGLPLDNGHEEDSVGVRHQYEQKFTSKRRSDSKHVGKTHSKTVSHCGTAKRNHDVRGTKREFSAENTPHVDQKPSKKVFCSSESVDLDEVLKL
ncbi:MRN complex-interacting protein [Ischnura elegans]|uniref:MRN complex-interacting protein n=1 Tax=Ischnura elegans TaxID=197161 RepID=UPI001ED88DC9|nr:MRN complex-interacting protein [Ischnura elegans]